MKKILVLLSFLLYSFAAEHSFLEPSEAFNVKVVEQDDKLVVQLKLGKSIYLYDEKLKVLINKPEKIEITKELDIPKPVAYEEFMVHFDDLNIEIPYSLLKSKVLSNKYEIIVEYQGCSKAGLCYAPMKETKKISFDTKNSSASSNTKTTLLTNDSLNETDLITKSLEESSFILVLATFFGFGLLLSLTPCVFPMIPILSSIIVKAGTNTKMTASRGFFLSLVYVISMSLAYTFAGILAGIFGANLQVALQNPYVLISFSIIFVLLALSMFGYFKIELPQSLQNKINKTTDGKEKDGIFGIAIMGFLSALIVGPCVAPPLAGALVYIGQTGDALLGGSALFIMSLGMGMPLLLIGLGAGKFMPKPGGWMDSITKLFGIVMLAIAIWMLDRVLEPIIIMFLWASLLLASGLYLKMYTHIIVRLISSLLFIYGTVVFVGAISGATNVLKPLKNFTSSTVVSSKDSNELKWKYVKNIKELDEAIKASSKPVMLDFYASWCVSCIELEEFTFTDKRVKEKLETFTLLKADVTNNTQDDKDLQKKYGIFGPPGLIFWSKEGIEIKRAKIIGYKNADEFLDITRGL